MDKYTLSVQLNAAKMQWEVIIGIFKLQCLSRTLFTYFLIVFAYKISFSYIDNRL